MKQDRAGQGASAIKRPQRLGNQVYDAIYARLMSLDIPPGGRLSIEGLSRELGVSQTPVREALSRLEVQKLVIKTHLVGYSAAPQIKQDQLSQLYDLRLLLEPHMTREAARQMSDAQLEELQALHAAMGEISEAKGQDYGEFAKLDGQFHDLIALGSGNEMIREALARQHVHVHLFRLLFHASATSEATLEHERIVEAIRNRDEDAAEDAMRRHILESRRRFGGAG